MSSFIWTIVYVDDIDTAPKKQASIVETQNVDDVHNESFNYCTVTTDKLLKCKYN